MKTNILTLYLHTVKVLSACKLHDIGQVQLEVKIYVPFPFWFEIPIVLSLTHLEIKTSSTHNGHQNAEIMHFRSEKVGSVRQFQLFLLIMHYLKTTKPTVQVDIPFKNQSNTQI